MENTFEKIKNKNIEGLLDFAKNKHPEIFEKHKPNTSGIWVDSNFEHANYVLGLYRNIGDDYGIVIIEDCWDIKGSIGLLFFKTK